ncbi:MAG: fibrobacter succinogenes major paralogous domain-containing protein [Mediterranea sp.]|jgi:hypothetical protein|nr:fibrobacter succinogenes major paralogous domain-containing protein [Mediterranea sp.]
MTSTSGFSNGYNWGTNALYPATGRRDGSDGSLLYVGDFGYCWTASTPRPIDAGRYNAIVMVYSSGAFLVNNGYARARGIPVRCVKE